MGKLLGVVRSVWMNVKLARGRCENCEAVLPDVHPIPGYLACSEECASLIWTSRIA